MRQKKYAEALALFVIAQKAVPEYTSWHLEYVYFALACQEKLNGRLSDAERQQALVEIEQGQFLLRRGFSDTGLTERYVGRLHQLRGEFAEAIPYLLASRKKLGGFDLVAADQALVVSYMQTKQFDQGARSWRLTAQKAQANTPRCIRTCSTNSRSSSGWRVRATNAIPTQGSTLTR